MEDLPIARAPFDEGLLAPGTLGRGQVLLPLRSRRASGHVGGLLPEQVALANAKQEAQVAFHYGVLALASARVR